MVTVLPLKMVEFCERRKTVHEFIPLKAIKKDGFSSVYTKTTNGNTKIKIAETAILLAEDELLVHAPPKQSGSSLQFSASHLKWHPPPVQIRWHSFTPVGQVMVHPPPAHPSVHFSELQVLLQPPPMQV